MRPAHLGRPMTVNIPANPVTAAATPHAADTTPRHNLFTDTHKALRLFMAATLCRLGRLSIEAGDEVVLVNEQLGTLLHLYRRHLEQESRYVHPAIEARTPGATSHAAAQCAQTLAEIHALEADRAALLAAPTAARAMQLYRYFALFVAESFKHMHFEETTLNELLRAGYGDVQLREFEQHLLAGGEPEASAILRTWMARSLATAEQPHEP